MTPAFAQMGRPVYSDAGSGINTLRDVILNQANDGDEIQFDTSMDIHLLSGIDSLTKGFAMTVTAGRVVNIIGSGTECVLTFHNETRLETIGAGSRLTISNGNQSTTASGSVSETGGDIVSDTIARIMQNVDIHNNQVTAESTGAGDAQAYGGGSASKGEMRWLMGQPLGSTQRLAETVCMPVAKSIPLGIPPIFMIMKPEQN